MSMFRAEVLAWNPSPARWRTAHTWFTSWTGRHPRPRTDPGTACRGRRSRSAGGARHRRHGRLRPEQPAQPTEGPLRRLGVEATPRRWRTLTARWTWPDVRRRLIWRCARRPPGPPTLAPVPTLSWWQRAGRAWRPPRAAGDGQGAAAAGQHRRLPAAGLDRILNQRAALAGRPARSSDSAGLRAPRTSAFRAAMRPPRRAQPPRGFLGQGVPGQHGAGGFWLETALTHPRSHYSQQVAEDSR